MSSAVFAVESIKGMSDVTVSGDGTCVDAEKLHGCCFLHRRGMDAPVVCVSVHPVVCVSVHPVVYISVHPVVCVSVHPVVCVPVHPVVCISVHPVVCISIA